MSASKMRKAAQEGDMKTLESGLPSSFKNNSEFKTMYYQSVLGGMS
jgi:hypothetical protein